MVRSLMRFGLIGLLLAAVVGPARALEPEAPTKLDEIQKQLRDIQGQLSLIQPEATSLRLRLTETEINVLKRRLDALEAQVRGPVVEAERPRVAMSYSPPCPETEMKDLRRRVEDIEARIHTRDERIARSFTPAQLSGPIYLQNRSPWVATIVLDGVSHELVPGRTVTLPARPVGTVIYSVFVSGFGEITPPTRRALVPDSPFTVFVNP
jgi:hypothetical protein